jgi:hypothetical protein
MKKLSLFLLLQIIVLLPGCKKDKDIINPEMAKSNDQLIRSILVKGAKSVTLDTTQRNIQIVLPESFTSDIIDLELSVVKGAELVKPSYSTLYEGNHVRYYFKGAGPEEFTIAQQVKNNTFGRSYRIFIIHEGPLTAEFTSEFAAANSGSEFISGEIAVRFESGMGSYPAIPTGGSKLIAALENKGKKFNVTSDYRGGNLYFEKINPLLDTDDNEVSLVYGEKTFRFPTKQKIKKGRAGIFFAYENLLFKAFPKGKTVSFNGGIFVGSKKYKVKIENDRIPSPLTFQAIPKHVGSLTLQFPESLPDDHYLASIYEEDSLIGKSPIVIAKDSLQRAIGQMWAQPVVGSSFSIVFQNDPIKIAKGKILYSNLFPVMIEGTNLPFDTTKVLPELELRNAGYRRSLKAVTQGDPSYGDGVFRLYYGAYTIPADVPTGKYEARLIHEKNQYSLPYWSLIEVH